MSTATRAGRLATKVPLHDWPAVVAAALVAVGVEVGLRILTLPRLARLAGTPLVAGGPGAAPGGLTVLPPRARRQVRATRRVMRHWPFGDTCLRQALVCGQRLRRLDPSLRVGVAKIDGEVRAHAWLEIDGGVLDPMASAGSYHVLQPIEPSGGAS